MTGGGELPWGPEHGETVAGVLSCLEALGSCPGARAGRDMVEWHLEGPLVAVEGRQGEGREEWARGGQWGQECQPAEMRGCGSAGSGGDGGLALAKVHLR